MLPIRSTENISLRTTKSWSTFFPHLNYRILQASRQLTINSSRLPLTVHAPNMNLKWCQILYVEFIIFLFWNGFPNHSPVEIFIFSQTSPRIILNVIFQNKFLRLTDKATRHTTTWKDMHQKSIQMTLLPDTSTDFEGFVLIVEITTETKAILFSFHTLIPAALCKLRSGWSLRRHRNQRSRELHSEQILHLINTGATRNAKLVKM